VAVAEKFGKRISLLLVPAQDVWSAIVQTANALGASAVVAGRSTRMASHEQAFNLGRAWEQAPEPKRQFVFYVVGADQHAETFRIGPHTPTMKPEDVEVVHRLWLDITRQPGLDSLHHSDIITEALERFSQEYGGMARDSILNEFRRLQQERSGGLPPLLPAPQGQADDPPPVAK
jgi:hypothetical protein